MLRSMTGYGRGEAEQDGWRYALQIKSVNSRFQEAPLKLPTALWPREGEARALIQKAVSRGKLDLHWKETRPSQGKGAVKVDMDLAASYRQSLESLAQGLGLPSDVRLEQVARFPDVISSGADDGEEAAEARWSAFKKALVAALDDLQKSREREGQALESELRGLLGQAKDCSGRIEAKSAELTPLFHERLKKRLASLWEAMPLDDPRLLGEAALAADKADIREEIVRFASHAAEFERQLDAGGAVGKRLDFLSQELLREANTMGSKSPDAALTQGVVELKSLIEKVKEQIQNLE